VLNGHESEGDSLVYHVLDMPMQTMQEKVKLLASISNYHWWASFDLSCNRKASKSVRYHQHLLFFPGESRKYLSASPRNMLMYALPSLPSSNMLDDRQLVGYAKSFSYNLMLLVKYDLEQGVEVVKSRQDPSLTEPPPPTNDDELEPAPKKRKYASRVISAGPEVLLEEAGLASRDGSMALKNAVSERSLFELFSLSMHSEDGFLQWRMHFEEEDVVVMNDYCPTSGKLKPLDYVHVKAIVTDSAELQIKCTCRIYQYMQTKALQRTDVEEGTDTVLDPHFTCMHCRFFSTYLQPMQATLRGHNPVSTLHSKLMQTDSEINSPIILLGEVSPGATTKLSVAGPDSVSLVHIHFTSSGCMAKCQDGACYAQYSIKKKIPKAISLRDIERKGMCDHLYTLFCNNDFLEEIFPHYFKNDPIPDAAEANAPSSSVSQDTDELNPAIDPDINTDDIGIKPKTQGYISFNVNEGKWQCTSHSDYTPSDNRFDPDLVRNTRARLQHFFQDMGPSGAYEGPMLKPKVVNEDDELLPCQCGQPFVESTTRMVHVYTRQVTIVFYI